MKLTLNREYATRHLFVTVLMVGLCGWFGYDGFVRYPATPAADLYRSIEGKDAPMECDLDAFKAQKTQTQYGFTFLAGLAAIIVGAGLWKARKFEFEFDDDGFAVGGKRFAYSDIKEVERSKWEKKGIIRIKGALLDVTLDAWHHVGVKEFVAKIGEKAQTRT